MSHSTRLGQPNPFARDGHPITHNRRSAGSGVRRRPTLPAAEQSHLSWYIRNQPRLSMVGEVTRLNRPLSFQVLDPLQGDPMVLDESGEIWDAGDYRPLVVELIIVLHPCAPTLRMVWWDCDVRMSWIASGVLLEAGEIACVSEGVSALTGRLFSASGYARGPPYEC